MIGVLVLVKNILQMFRFDGARSGKNEDVFGPRVDGEFDGWFGANKIKFRKIFTQAIDTFSGGGVAGDDNNYGAPVLELFNIIGDNFVEFGVGLFAVRTIFGIGNIGIFFVW